MQSSGHEDLLKYSQFSYSRRRVQRPRDTRLSSTPVYEFEPVDVCVYSMEMSGINVYPHGTQISCGAIML